MSASVETQWVHVCVRTYVYVYASVYCLKVVRVGSYLCLCVRAAVIGDRSLRFSLAVVIAIAVDDCVGAGCC